MMKKYLLLISILVIFLSACQSKQAFSVYATKPIYQNPESEFEGFLFDYVLDKMIYYAFTIPKKAQQKHDKAIFASIINEELGKNYIWKHSQYYGVVRVVMIVSNKKFICKTIIHEIGIQNYKKKTRDDKICLDYQTGKWAFIDDNFYHKYF